MGCERCGSTSALLIKDEGGQKVCPACFVQESPMIDEGWRIVREVLDKGMEWEDSHEIERRTARARRNN